MAGIRARSPKAGALRGRCAAIRQSMVCQAAECLAVCCIKCRAYPLRRRASCTFARARRFERCLRGIGCCQVGRAGRFQHRVCPSTAVRGNAGRPRLLVWRQRSLGCRVFRALPMEGPSIAAGTAGDDRGHARIGLSSSTSFQQVCRRGHCEHRPDHGNSQARPRARRHCSGNRRLARSQTRGSKWNLGSQRRQFGMGKLI